MIDIIAYWADIVLEVLGREVGWGVVGNTEFFGEFNIGILSIVEEIVFPSFFDI